MICIIYSYLVESNSGLFYVVIYKNNLLHLKDSIYLRIKQKVNYSEQFPLELKPCRDGCKLR